MQEHRNPKDGKIPAFQPGSVRPLVAAQREFFLSGSTRPLETRLELLRQIDGFLETSEEEILAALEADLGKPAIEAWLSEVYFLRQELKLVFRKLKRWAKPRRAGHPIFVLPASSRIHREPWGVTLVIGPWNYPLQLLLAPAIGAIAAGNCAVLKPSESAPATARLVADFFDSHVAREHVAVVNGGPELGAALLEAPFDFLFFTGGEEVGRKVSAAAGRRMVPCALELGGKSPAVVDTTCDLGMAVERIVSGKFFNAGQTCMGPDFVAVPESLLEKFMELLESKITEYYGKGEMEIARLPNRFHWDRLTRLIPENARQVGEDDRDSFRMAPRWALVGQDSPAMDEEIFGPFLPVVTYAERDELVARLSSKRSPLALYLFSTDPGFIEALMRNVKSGSVCVNDVMKQAVNLELPFGGVGGSGYGRYRGRYSYECFSYERPVTKRYQLPDPFAAHPPYGNLLRWLRKFL